ncbi:MAG: histidine kinase dimerization/phospho-acceptor domain-containing protein [Caldilineaceae bacterium]
MTAYRQAEAERERSLLLEKEKVKAEAASNAKSDFLATMSHELRTPLNSILGYAQILQDQTRLTTFQRRSVQTILANGRHLLNLIQDVLDLSRIEADRLTIVYADVALHPLLAEVVNAVQVKAAERAGAVLARAAAVAHAHPHR